jgi:hypothetical protein
MSDLLVHCCTSELAHICRESIEQSSVVNVEIAARFFESLAMTQAEDTVIAKERSDCGNLNSHAIRTAHYPASNLAAK